MKKFFLVTLPVLILLGCTKEDAFLVDSFRDCDQPKRDVTELTSELLGSWELREKACGLCSEDFSREVKEEVMLTFKTDTTFTVEDENSEVLETGQWEVLDNEAGAYIKVTVAEGSSQYLPGIIGICKNQLFADLTYKDLFGFLYVRIK